MGNSQEKFEINRPNEYVGNFYGTGEKDGVTFTLQSDGACQFKYKWENEDAYHDEGGQGNWTIHKGALVMQFPAYLVHDETNVNCGPMYEDRENFVIKINAAEVDVHQTGRGVYFPY